MEELFERLWVVFQFTITSYGLGIWLVFAILCFLLCFVIYRPKKITFFKICRALLYAYIATYFLIFNLLAQIEENTKWIVLSLIMVALPVMKRWVKGLNKYICELCKKGKQGK